MTRQEAKVAKDKLYNLEFDYEGDSLIDEIYDEFEADNPNWNTGLPTEDGLYICKLTYKSLVSPWHILVWMDKKWLIPHTKGIIQNRKVEKWLFLDKETAR